MVGQHELQRAEFEEFAWRDHKGRVRFDGQRPPPAKRLAGVLADPARVADHRRLGAEFAVALNRSLRKAIRLQLARRWVVQCPLGQQWDCIDDAIGARHWRER